MNIFKKFRNKAIDTVEAIEEKPVIVKKPMRTCNIFIYLNDGGYIGFNTTNPVQRTVTAKMKWIDFYKWYFYRESSESYTFNHSLGCTIIKKSTIKYIEFKHEDIEV